MAHDLRTIIRMALERKADSSAVIIDSRTLQSRPESGARAGFDGHKKRKGSKVHAAVDTLGHLVALSVTPANEEDRAQVGQMAQAIQAVVDEPVQIAFVDQGYTGEAPAAAAAQAGIHLEVVKHHEAKHGCVLLPRRWVVERSFAWAARSRRLARLCHPDARYFVWQKLSTGFRCVRIRCETSWSKRPRLGCFKGTLTTFVGRDAFHPRPKFHSPLSAKNGTMRKSSLPI